MKLSCCSSYQREIDELKAEIKRIQPMEDRIVELKGENKRYRKVLEEIAEETGWQGALARKTLDGDSA